MTELGVAALALQVALAAVQGVFAWRQRGKKGDDAGDSSALVLARIEAVASRTEATATRLEGIAGSVSHLASESVRLSSRVEEVAKRVHDQGGLVGAAAMVPEMMRKVTGIGEKVAHIEGLLLRRRDANVE